jgi:GAF domain-containing protein
LKFNAQLTRQVLETQDTICLNVVDKADSRRKWYVVQPVKIEGEMVGILFVHIQTERMELARETETIRKIGEMMSIELTKNLQLETSRIKTEKLSAITEASYDLASARSLNELAQIVVSVACLVLESQSCVLRVKGRRRGTLDILDSFSMGSSANYRDIQKLDEVVAKDSFDASRMLVLCGREALSKYDSKGIVRSALSMCLQSNGRRLGTMSLYDKTSSDLSGPSEFNSGDREIFLNVCLQISKALERFIP